MCKIPTLYSDYQECILDLDIYGKIVATPQQSIEDLTKTLFEEFKRRKPFPTLEYKRYELSKLVNPDYRIAYNKELELQDNESLIELKNIQSSFESINFEDLTPLIPEVQEAFSYEMNITDSVRREIIEKYDLETGEEFKPGIKQTEDIIGTVEEDSDLILSDEEISNLGVEKDEAILDINESYEPTNIIEEETLPIEVDEDFVDYDSYDNSTDESESLGENFNEDSIDDSDDYDDFSVYEEDNTEEEQEDDYSSYEEQDDSDDLSVYDDESEDIDSDDYDDYSQYEDDSSEEVEDNDSYDDYSAYENDSLEDSEEENYEEEYDDYSQYENDLDDNNIDSDNSNENEEEYDDYGIYEDSKSDDSELSSSNIDNFDDSILEEPDFSDYEEQVVNKQVDIPVTPAQVHNNVQHQEVIDRSTEPTDIRAFLRKHPRCDYEFALKYFTKKQINDAIKIGKIVKKGNMLKI